MMNKFLRRLIRSTLIIFILTATLFVGFFCGKSLQPQFGVDVDSADWMPKGASDGAYFNWGVAFPLSSPSFYFEYDISEQNFVEYMTRISSQPSDINEPEIISRYLKPLIRIEDYESEYITDDGDVGTFVDYKAYERASSKVVTDGLSFSERPLGEDHSRHYVYDRKRGRAFIEIHTR